MTATRLNPDNAAFVHKMYDLTDFTVQYAGGQQKCTLSFNDLYSIDFKASGTIEMWKNNNGTWNRVWSK